MCCLSFYIIRYFILLSGIFIYRVGKLIEPWFPQRQSEIESWDQDIFFFSIFINELFSKRLWKRASAIWSNSTYTHWIWKPKSKLFNQICIGFEDRMCVEVRIFINTNQNHIQTTQESLSCLRLKLLRLNQYLSVHAVKFFLEWALFFFTRFTQLLIEIKECSMKMDVCHKICK